MTGGRLRGVLVVAVLPMWSVLWGGFSMVAGWLRSAPLFRVGLGNWSRGVVWLSGVRIEVVRSAKFNNAPSVFVSNHQSALDIPILSTVCLQTHDVRFIAKESLFKIPFLGWAIAGNGFIPIRRENARHAAETFKEVAAKNSPDYSYIVFPEGTRSEDGHIRDFKRGSIALVMRLNRPLVPVTIVDACRANPKNKLLVRPGTVRVIFHEPIAVPQERVDDRNLREQLTLELHDRVASALPDDQK
jgi:1-acyl-sn-glycerol-3-phosphate acyltransferase